MGSANPFKALYLLVSGITVRPLGRVLGGGAVARSATAQRPAAHRSRARGGQQPGWWRAGGWGSGGLRRGLEQGAAALGVRGGPAAHPERTPTRPPTSLLAAGRVHRHCRAGQPGAVVVSAWAGRAAHAREWRGGRVTWGGGAGVPHVVSPHTPCLTPQWRGRLLRGVLPLLRPLLHADPRVGEQRVSVGGTGGLLGVGAVGWRLGLHPLATSAHPLRLTPAAPAAAPAARSLNLCRYSYVMAGWGIFTSLWLMFMQVGLSCGCALPAPGGLRPRPPSSSRAHAAPPPPPCSSALGGGAACPSSSWCARCWR